MIIFGAFFKCSLNSSLRQRERERESVQLLIILAVKAVEQQTSPPDISLFVIMLVCVTYVRPPSPIEVKKLMAKRVFLGLSRGKSPSKNVCRVLKHTRTHTGHVVT